MVNIILFSLLGICIIGLMFCSYMLKRNNQVYARRVELLKKASDESHRRIQAGREDWEAPYDYLNKISYDEMMRKFWKPVNSFHSEEEMLAAKTEKVGELSC